MLSLRILLGILPLWSVVTTKTTVRVMTWNVADNSKMQGSFRETAIDEVLGLNKGDHQMPTIYAIGLQENCWMCNEKNLQKIGERFISRINRKAQRKYVIIGIQGTRMSSTCEMGCLVNTHGTTLLLVIGEISLGASHSAFKHNDGCSSKFPRNKEKGLAAMRIKLKSGIELCFATAHLDSKHSSYRRTCLKDFFTNANKKTNWTNACDAQFIFGDFNTRTGDKTKGPSLGKYVPTTTAFGALRLHDELTGAKPYGTGSEWTSNLLSYINQIQPKKFLEASFNFMPTYSIKPSKEFCSGNFPCYRTNRPMSWTDRIIYTRGTHMVYDAIYKEYGDHLPVFADFNLDL